MIEYVVGFLFDAERTVVALVRKQKPPWQAGLLNGIGGKRNPGETWEEAMSREFEEEAGTRIDDWEHTVTLASGVERWELRVFRAFSDQVYQVRTMEPETVEVVCLSAVEVDWPGRMAYLDGCRFVPNLAWILPLSLDDTIQYPVVFTQRGE